VLGCGITGVGLDFARTTAIQTLTYLQAKSARIIIRDLNTQRESELNTAGLLKSTIAFGADGETIFFVGFDLNGTPFGALVSQTAVYKYGYEPFTLEAVTPIVDFINESNIEYARANSSNPADRAASIADFNQGIASSLEAVKKRWREVPKR
jgi:hypothetical protein